MRQITELQYLEYQDLIALKNKIINKIEALIEGIDKMETEDKMSILNSSSMEEASFRMKYRRNNIQITLDGYIKDALQVLIK